ncbi:MAG: sulfotransferase [Sphingomonas sp.]|nr:sulfotransferase [Sphingomonas sp.]
MQKQVRQFDDALESYVQALEYGVGGAEEVRLNRAVILGDFLHRPDEALIELDQALKLRPDYVPALLNLGNLHEDQGRREEAQASYRAALDHDPGNALALARLAGVSHAQPLDRGLADRLVGAIAVPGIDGAAKADLGFALGGLLDAAGEYDDAFAAYAAANRASREAGGKAAIYDRGQAEQLIDRLIAAFPAAPPPARMPKSAPLFICGLFRSGSTLVERILGASGRVAAAGELDLIPALARAIAEYPQGASTWSDAAVAEWRQSYLAALPEQPGDERIVTDKRPDNFLHLGLIKRLFPSARIIHTRRNPLDNILSLYFLHLDPGMAYALDLDDAAHWHGEYRRLMDHWLSLYGHDILTVDYDALVRNPETKTRRLFEFCGIDWTPAVLDFQARAGTVKTASVWQVRESLYTRSSGRWRNYAHHLEAIRKIIAGY